MYEPAEHPTSSLTRLLGGLDQLRLSKAERRPGPEVTVAVMSYNNARYLPATIESILSQEGVRLELVVIDDCSTDNSLQVLEACGIDDPRFRYEVNEQNLGMVRNYNKCLRAGAAPLVVVLGSDDVLFPGHLAALVRGMQQHPRVALGYTQCTWIDADGNVLHQAVHPGHPAQDCVGGRDEIVDLLRYDNYITPSAVILRRSVLSRLELDDGLIHRDMLAGDWELWTRVARVAPDFLFLRQATLGYRIHEGQISNAFYGSDKPLAEHTEILELNLAEPEVRCRLQREAEAVWQLYEQRMKAFPPAVTAAYAERARAIHEALFDSEVVPTGPMFSVILTTFNRPELLVDALRSLAAQQLQDFEAIVVNDHGVPVEALLEGFEFPLTYLYLGRNGGQACARNQALRLAQGRYICFLDDDDLYLPSHLSTLAQALQETPEAILYTRAWYVPERLEDGQRIELDRQPAYLHDTFSPERLLVSNYIPVNTWCVPTPAFDKAGVFDASLTALEDWELLLRLARVCSLRHLAVPSVEVRIRDTLGDHTSQRQRSNFPALFREIYKRNPSEHPQVQSERALFLDALDNEMAHGVPAANDPVTQWMQKRRFTAVQKRLTADHISRNPLPVVGLVIVHVEGDEALLARTLASLPDRSWPGLVTVVGLVSMVAPGAAAGACAQVAQVDAPAAVPAAINRLAGSLAADWLLLVNAGDEVVAEGLLVAALELAQGPLCTSVYADQLYRKPDGSLGAALFPDFNLDMSLSFPGAMARRWFYHRDTLLAKGGFENRFGRAFELDYILRQIEADGIGSVGHISEPLLKVDAPRMVDEPDERGAITAHLERRGYADAKVSAGQPGRYRIDYAHAERPLVSIIIPTKDQLPMLQRCVETLLERTAYQHYEVLIVDNNSEEADAREWLTAIEGLDDPKLRVLRFPHPFNYSAMNNLAAAQARGEYLLLLNNDTATLKEDWLEQLLNHAQRPEVGIVGAKLLYPDGCIQHAGVLLGLRGPAEHPFIGEPMGASGYLQRLEIDQNYSAVTAACLMIRKSVYDAVGGMDEEAFKVSYNDVDLCLKVGASGHLVVWTPHAVVLHEGSVSQRNVDTASVEQKRKRFAAEQDALYEKWLPLIARDPAYNRNLALSGKGFELEADTELNWRPLVWRPLPIVLAHPADPWGCGNYRVIKPFEALRDAGMIEGTLSEGLLQVVDLERYDPDVVLLQRQIGDERLEAMRRIKQFSRAFKIYELDDYLPNLPLKNVHRSHMPKDVIKALRKGLGYVDRFVVSTAPLAEALAGMHGDIVVVENRLPVDWWKGLKGLRGCGDRPRVGWAGGAGHMGDLELIADVVRELASEVDWVFFGLCPERIRPWVKEVHSGVDIDRYPAALARLNLDLAVAPLERNLFNDCKSNLRLLEYGACGFPVVCSDVPAYQGDLPVTRVKNRFKDWVDAIRMHLDDPDASARTGDDLQRRVTSEWMLDGGNLEVWRKAWTVRGA